MLVRSAKRPGITPSDQAKKAANTRNSASSRLLPHSAAAQYNATTRVAISNLQPGDLVFFGSDIHHVGIYVGGGTMIEAPYTGVDVRYHTIYRSDFAGAARP